MKKIKFITAVLLFFAAFNFSSCSTENEPLDPAIDLNNTPTIPIIITDQVIDIDESSAFSGGTISSDGGSAVTSRGVVWSTTQSPTILDSKTVDGAGIGSFTSDITGLSSSTTYYVRAYATNSIGTAYGNQISFTTTGPSNLPILTTSAVSNIADISASSGGNISADGGTPVSARGVVWSTSQNPTILDSKTVDGSGIGSFTSDITGLTADTTYYVRAYATNTNGTSYGNQVTFTTTNLPVFTIGQNYEGGIIFYIDGTGQHGLIAAAADQGTLPWGCVNTPIVGTATAIGTGMANTNFIVNQCNETGTAAKICYDLILNGKDDWYLPSKDELYQLYLKKSVVGGFANTFYWSSSQSTVNTNEATIKSFSDTSEADYIKWAVFKVRPIRSF